MRQPASSFTGHQRRLGNGAGRFLNLLRAVLVSFPIFPKIPSSTSVSHVRSWPLNGAEGNQLREHWYFYGFLVYRPPTLPRKCYGSLPVGTIVCTRLYPNLFQSTALDESPASDESTTEWGGGKPDERPGLHSVIRPLIRCAITVPRIWYGSLPLRAPSQTRKFLRRLLPGEK